MSAPEIAEDEHRVLSQPQSVAVPRPSNGGVSGSVETRAKRQAESDAGFPSDYDQDIRELIRTVRPRTMTHNDKIHGLHAAVRYIVKHEIHGDIVECGVWRGGSMQAVALTLLSLGVADRSLYLFDTFAGMPEPTEKDVRHDGRSAAELMAGASLDDRIMAYASLDDVREGMAETGYPPELVHFVEGMVEDTLPEAAPDHIALLRLDTDWYASTLHELNTLYSRLSPGGVLIIDDYGWFDGARGATDEFLENCGDALLLIRMASGRIGVKPYR